MNWIATASSAVVLVACGPRNDGATPQGQTAQAPAASSTHAAEAVSIKGSWRIVAFDGRSPAAASNGRAPGITFAEQLYWGSAGCNQLGGLGLARDGRYYAKPGPQTVMACAQPLLQQEATLAEVLRASPSLTRSGPDRLTLSGAGHRLSLLREEHAGNGGPFDQPADLGGTRFVIQSIDGEYLTPRSRADRRALTFGASRWTASLVCVTVAGTWRTVGSIILAKLTETHAGRCGPEGRTTDAAVRALFASDPSYALDPTGGLLIAGGGHWLVADRDTTSRDSVP